MIRIHLRLFALLFAISAVSVGCDSNDDLPTPTVNTVTPATGDVEGGTAVTLTGTNYVAGQTVTFDEFSATNVVVVNSTTITAVTPSHEPGSVDVQVTNTDGGKGTLGGGFTYE
jgi:hypothetical protein